MGVEKRPGGRYQEKQETIITSLLDTIPTEKRSPVVEALCQDEDFAKAFAVAVPEVEEQVRYMRNTSQYGLQREDYDPAYVLLFRRTLPTDRPKPEERWTNDYLIVRNGLRLEIPEGPHRWHSIILCDTLEHLMVHGEKEGEQNPFADGEVVVTFPEYDQSECLCVFKTSDDEQALEAYLETEGAISLEEIREEVMNAKSVERKRP